jgi:hypothetical protein
MAEAIHPSNVLPNWIQNASNLEAQNDEIDALKSFYENTNNLEVIEAADTTASTLHVLQVYAFHLLHKSLIL